MKKKLFAALLSLVMLLALLPSAALATDGDETPLKNTSGTITTAHLQIDYAIDMTSFQVVSGDKISFDVDLKITGTQAIESVSLALYFMSSAIPEDSSDLASVNDLSIEISTPLKVKQGDEENFLIGEYNGSELQEVYEKTLSFTIPSGTTPCAFAIIEIITEDDALGILNDPDGSKTLNAFKNSGRELSSTSYFVTYVSDGSVQVPDKDATSFNRYTIPEDAVPIRADYYFAGWQSNGDTYQPGDTIENISADITLTAQWVAASAVTITWPTLPSGITAGDGWEASPATDGTVTFTLITDAAYIPGSQTVKAGETTLTGTAGAATDSGTPYTYTFSVLAYTSPIAISVEAPKQPVVTFDSQGGSAVSPQTVAYNGTAAAPEDPTRAGYTFEGWYYNGAPYDFSTSVTADITLTAQWRAIPAVSTYAITVESAENGAVTASASRAAAGSRVTLTVAPSEGYALDTLTATDASDNALTLTETATGYTFTMPASAVTVTAIFEEINHADTCPSEHFTDVDLNSWYHEALDYVIENGLMIGTSDTTFEPEATMNRAMLAQILYNMEGQPEVTGESAFTDVTAEDWYHDAVVWAAENSIVLGYSDTEFGPLDAISREQFAVMLYRYADFKGLDTSASGDLSAFTDAASISDWATEAVTWAVGTEVLRGYGDGILNPIGGSTRAEAAQMLLNFSEIQ